LSAKAVPRAKAHQRRRVGFEEPSPEKVEGWTMGDLEDQIRTLRAETDANRAAFLRTDLQTCFIALDRARFELALGNRDEAEKEFVLVSRGAEVIAKFLEEAADQQAELAPELAALRTSLASLRLEIDQ